MTRQHVSTWNRMRRYAASVCCTITRPVFPVGQQAELPEGHLQVTHSLTKEFTAVFDVTNVTRDAQDYSTITAKEKPEKVLLSIKARTQSTTITPDVSKGDGVVLAKQGEAEEYTPVIEWTYGIVPYHLQADCDTIWLDIASVSTD